MKLRKTFAVVAFLAFLLLPWTTTTTTAAKSRDDGPKLLARLDRENNPVKKAKIEVRLARLRLDQAFDAYDNGHYNEFWKLLGEYQDYMKKAWAELQASGRIAAKKPDGFKQLDIGLRESRRDLEDFETHITFEERREVQKIRARMEVIHNQVLNALFPQPSGKKKKQIDSSGQTTDEDK
jgi:hypothetical protein